MEGLLLAARAAGVTDERVLDAIRDTPRAAFVPPHLADIADLDKPLPLPHGLVTTQPSLTAVMIAGLNLGGGERVLEIGTGYGYQAALLARLAARVISIEIWPDVADQARRNVASQGLVNVTVVAGDGTQGYPPDAPWDAIIVSAAFPRVPPPLTAQLKVGGRLVQPIGPGGDEDVVLFERGRDGLRRVRVLSAARFVQLRGRHGMPSLPVLPTAIGQDRRRGRFTPVSCRGRAQATVRRFIGSVAGGCAIGRGGPAGRAASVVSGCCDSAR